MLLVLGKVIVDKGIADCVSVLQKRTMLLRVSDT